VALDFSFPEEIEYVSGIVTRDLEHDAPASSAAVQAQHQTRPSSGAAPAV
jgi:hypothetical protein